MNQQIRLPSIPMKTKTDFTFQLCFSKKEKDKIRVMKGLINDSDFYVVKIIQCNQNQELLRRKILHKRQASKLSLNHQSAFTSKTIIQTVVYQSEKYKRRFLHLFTPYVQTSQMTKFVSTSTTFQLNPISQSQKAERINQIILKLIVKLISASNYQLYSYNSIFFTSRESKHNVDITINQQSFVGMFLLLNNQEISKQDFCQIFELLGSSILEKKADERFTTDLKHRAIGMVLINLIFQRKISVFHKKSKWQAGTKGQNIIEKCQSFLKQSKQLFHEFLSHKQVKQKIQAFQKINKVNYMLYLYQVFALQKSMKWSDAVKYLVPKWKPQQIAIASPPTNAFIFIRQLKYIYKYKSLNYQTNILQQLGLDTQSEYQIFFIALLTGKDTNAEQLLGLMNLDQFLLNPNQFKLQHNNALFKRLIKLTNLVISKNRYITAQRSISQQKNLQSMIPKTSKLQQQFDHSQNIENTNFDIDFLQFLNIIAKNFGTLNMRVQNKKFLTRNHDVNTLKRYYRLAE